MYLDEALIIPNRSTRRATVSSLYSFFFLIVLAIGLAVYLARRYRRRCPHHNPHCCSSKPCILCYRDLFKATVMKGGVD